MNGNNLTPTGLFNPNLRMSSVEIAELTEKEHKHVCRDIRNMLEKLKEDRYAEMDKDAPEYDRGSRTQYKYAKPSTIPKVLDHFLGDGPRLDHDKAEYAVTAEHDARGYIVSYFLDFHSSMVLITGYDVAIRSKVIARWMQLERGEALPAVQQRQMVVVDIQEHIALLKEHTDLLKQAMASLKKEANNRKNFTADDDARVLHLHGLGYTPAQIGDAIGRKKGSVRSCLRRLHKKGILADASRSKDGGQMELFPAGVLDGGEE
jgi:hypothetical protein